MPTYTVKTPRGEIKVDTRQVRAPIEGGRFVLRHMGKVRGGRMAIVETQETDVFRRLISSTLLQENLRDA